MAKHKSNRQKKLDLKSKKRKQYVQPAIKKSVCLINIRSMKAWIRLEKKSPCTTKKNRWYNSLDPTEKEKVSSQRAEYYKSLDGAGKKRESRMV